MDELQNKPPNSVLNMTIGGHITAAIMISRAIAETVRPIPIAVYAISQIARYIFQKTTASLWKPAPQKIITNNSIVVINVSGISMTFFAM